MCHFYQREKYELKTIYFNANYGHFLSNITIGEFRTKLNKQLITHILMDHAIKFIQKK